MLDYSEEDLVDINELVSQGFTREEAQLIVFEDKYGKVDNQGIVRQVLVSNIRGCTVRFCHLYVLISDYLFLLHMK
jgi:hypothetical protein